MLKMSDLRRNDLVRVRTTAAFRVGEIGRVDSIGSQMAFVLFKSEIMDDNGANLLPEELQLVCDLGHPLATDPNFGDDWRHVWCPRCASGVAQTVAKRQHGRSYTC